MKLTTSFCLVLKLRMHALYIHFMA